MKLLNTSIFIPAILLLTALPAFSQTAPAAGELTKLLNYFLAGAGRNDAAVHDRFWAEDLIYTRSAGVRINKAELMKGVRSAPAPKPDDPVTVYSAEEVRVHQYGCVQASRHCDPARRLEDDIKSLQHRHLCKTKRQMAGRGLAGDRDPKSGR